MSSVAIVDKGAPTRKVKYGSISRDRAWALRWSYFFLVIFAFASLVPPIYMLVTSLKSSTEISAATNPWWVFHPTLENYIVVVESVSDFLPQLRDGFGAGRHHHHAD
jgi:multiple sugar transport system permease protein